MDLGSLLRQKRKEKGLTLEQVGNAIGVSKNTVSKYERNMIANMGNQKRLALAKLLDIPPALFIEAVDSIETQSEQITAREFQFEVKELLSKTNNISEQEKALLVQTLEFVCSDKK